MIYNPTPNARNNNNNVLQEELARGHHMHDDHIVKYKVDKQGLYVYLLWS